MADAMLGTFSCEGCGKQYAWKPELAGRAVKCRCGAVMRAPAEPPSPDDALYGLTDQPTAVPVPVHAVSASPAPATSAAPHVAPPKVLKYAGKLPPPPSNLDTDKLKNLHAPLALAAGGLVVLGASAWWNAGLPAITALGIQLIIGTALTLAAVFIAARRRGFQVGPLGSAVLKLLAVSLAPAAAMSLFSLLFSSIPLGFVFHLLTGGVGLLIGFCLYFALIGFFFDLDQEDTWYCVCVIFLVNVAVSLAGRWWF